MLLSCRPNSVNVYTIAYRVQYTYTCTRAHPQRTSSRGKARVSDKSADKLARIVVRVRQADTLTSARAGHEDPRAEVGEDVRVGVRVGPVEFKLYC